MDTIKPSLSNSRAVQELKRSQKDALNVLSAQLMREHQLCRQYVEGIYRPKYYNVTLKSKLRVTQGHWKQNHWIDYTRLTITRVI